MMIKINRFFVLFVFALLFLISCTTLNEVNSNLIPEKLTIISQISLQITPQKCCFSTKDQTVFVWEKNSARIHIYRQGKRINTIGGMGFDNSNFSRLVDIAKLTGFSAKTVSRTLRNDAYVAPKTREKILEAAKILNYTPNRIAQSLRYQHSQEILFLPWAISDYGRSTARVLETFFVCTVIFAAVYAFAPGLVANLHAVDGVRVSPRLLPIRAIYFSIVTMTTLGFGDTYAAPGSAIGQILLMIQVMTGYALLGALVTRLAILFQET
jgi:transcriptional regulator with XRE-family HTH domain